MIEIPLGKALVAVLAPRRGDTSKCRRCCLRKKQKCLTNKVVECNPFIRKDGKDVIFKLVDYPAKGDK